MDRLSIAPMMEVTDRHFRYFLRLITKRTLLYTEMIPAKAILRGDRSKLLDFDPSEHSVVLQLGGSDPIELAECTRIAEEWSYDGVNLNCGCPSPKVKEGRFGACLMGERDFTASLVKSMKLATRLPVTVKHRLGTDQENSYENLLNFAKAMLDAGADGLNVHARIAILEGLNPKQNRSVPPLKYDWVYRLKEDLPHAKIEINGGIRTLAEVKQHLNYVDSVMIGRAAQDDPFMLSQADCEIFSGSRLDRLAPSIISPGSSISRNETVQKMFAYAERMEGHGVPSHFVLRHLTGLFHSMQGAKKLRSVLVRKDTLGNKKTELLDIL